MRVDNWQLVDKETGREVSVGDVLTDFRGDLMTLKGGQPPHKIGSTGRVQVDECGRERSFFPGVCDLSWVEVNDD